MHILSGLLICLAGLIFIASRNYPVGSWGVVESPGFFPRILAVLLIVLAIWLATQEILARRAGNLPKHAEDTKLTAHWYLLVAILVASPFMLTYLGFKLTSFILLISTIIIFKTRRERLQKVDFLTITLVSLGFTILMVIFFENILRLPLPRGLL